MLQSEENLCVRKSRSIFIVTSGLIKVAYTDPQGNHQEYFLASGQLPTLAPKPSKALRNWGKLETGEISKIVLGVLFEFLTLKN